MGIKIKHGDPKAQLAAAAEIGERKKQEAAQLRQEQINFQTMLRQQDQMLELEKYERSKRWEIDKMELASRLDFEREEKVRQRRLDNADNALAQIDKEVQAGRMSEEEAYPLRLKYTLEKEGVDAPVSLVRPQGRGDEYGTRPHWMAYKDAPEGSDERKIYEANLKNLTEGRTGTTPARLDPDYLRTLPLDVAEQILMSQEIFFDTPEELKAFIGSDETQEEGIQEAYGEKTQGSVGQIMVISPAGVEGTIPVEQLAEALASGYTQTSKAPLEEPLPVEQPEEVKKERGLSRTQMSLLGLYTAGKKLKSKLLSKKGKSIEDRDYLDVLMGK